MTDKLNVENLVCFKLYVCAKEITRKYTPYLKPYGLTYTQYIVLLTIHEYKNINIKKLGDIIYLDSGTLSPLLNKLETKKLISKEKDQKDDRLICVSLTQKGIDLYNKAKNVHNEVGSCLKLSSSNKSKFLKELNVLLNNIEN